MTFLLYLIYLVLIVAPISFLYFFWKAKSVKETEVWEDEVAYTTLLVQVPKNNEKSPLAAEQMFASLHGIYSEAAKVQHHFSFEIVSIDKFVQFYLFVPTHLVDFVEGQIYAQYPTVEIDVIEDYSKKVDLTGKFYAGCELKMTKPDVYPVKMFSDFEVDPLSAITSMMSKVQPNDEVWLQIVIRPVGDEWQERGIDLIKQVRNGTYGKSFSLKEIPKNFNKLVKDFGKNFLKLAFNPMIWNTGN